MPEKIEFYKAVYSTKELPGQGYPEVILCGRSNVGKSSFINSLFSRKNLAKTSSIPGKTRSLNYYLVNGNFFLVDLPGFGYANTSKKEREYWKKIIDEYFNSKRKIITAFHIIDSRHPVTELDFQLNVYLKNNHIPYCVLLNKVDKLNQSEKATSVKNIRGQLPDLVYGKNLFPYSSVDGTGKRELKKIFDELMSH